MSAKKTSTPPASPAGTTLLTELSSYGSFDRGLSTLSVEDRGVFGSEDAFLLLHFASNASFDLIGDQSLWVKKVLPLALQVCTYHELERPK